VPNLVLHRPSSLPRQPDPNSLYSPRRLDPALLHDHIELLHRTACRLCRSSYDAEDLVQETLARVLTRPRLLRNENAAGYLLRALRNTQANRRRTASRRPPTVSLAQTDPPGRAQSSFDALEVMRAIAAAPKHYRDAVVAIDLEGLTYKQAARELHTPLGTLTTRVARGRQHVARALSEPAVPMGATRGQ
jgi:RNA polymerase sigma-70 factor, ECF subfamily